ncbi:fatty acid--CoA ligase family protein [Mycobacterium sp. NBC_00419]|uniref:class I adenylate-forming enzyme family protein n=1 Tax=Mycobacterium sp. NBC_00419 TaxID=2975989 RepID=UPI002E1E4F2E
MNAAPMSGRTGMQDLLTRSRISAPSATGLIVDGAEYTFEQLATAAEALAEKLPHRTRVVVVLANNAASVVAAQAVWLAGCSIVAASPMVPEAEVRRRAEVTAASAYLVPAAGDSLDVEIRSTGRQETAPTGEALVMFTSGTTGTPKGASLTFSALRGSVAGIAAGNGLPDGGRPPAEPARDPRIVLVPIAHMGGFLGVLTAWWLGKPALLVEKFTAQRVFDIAQRWRLGVLGLTPAMVWELAQTEQDGSLPGVDSVIVGTAAIPEATRLAFEAKYDVPVLRNYGQTEFAGAIAFERPGDVAAGKRPEGTVGRVAPGVEVVIVDPEGSAVATGGVGEILARAASAMTGYLGDDGRPAGSDEWLHTGDLGRLDDDGFLFVVGRVRDMVVCGGFNVYPAQVETALNDLPEVADSAVAGLPDERLGEVPVAAVVLNKGARADAESLRQALRSRLAPYELPRRLVFVDAIPRHDTGKVNRDEIARIVKTP